eukprot:m.190788 g.190788  ORF g.190788 m.190788 type:complete len:58 (-) comp14829_c1_seq2:854-1027(-)
MVLTTRALDVASSYGSTPKPRLFWLTCAQEIWMAGELDGQATQTPIQRDQRRCTTPG